MSTAHTPGPWECPNIEESYNSRQFWVCDEEGGLIAVAESGWSEAEANARLIAAAPDLLAALEAEEEWRARAQAGAIDPDWHYETMVAALRRAAIAKATGGAA